MSNVIEKYVGPKEQTNDIKSKWWNQKSDQMYQHINGVVNAIDQSQSYRRTRNLAYARLYSNMDFRNFYGTSFSQNVNLQNRVTLNVVKSCVDTVCAKISKNKPKPMFLTENGNFTQQTRAKNLTKYIEGIFHSENIYEKAQKMFMDSCVLGTGVLKFFVQDNQIKVEWIIADEIKVDDTEGMYGEPRQIFQTKYIHKDVLTELFPEYAQKIKQATGGVKDDYTKNSADMIQVVEAWHIRSSSDSKDGKHAISIENCTLFEEEWTKDYFPFVFFRWSPRLLGFYGSGIPEEIRGLQIEVNKLLINIQRAQHLQSHPKAFVEANSMVNSAHINNEDGGIIKYTGTKPSFEVPQAMSQEVYMHLENLYRKAFEIVGISQLSATGKKPAGLDAAVALREYNDIETERFILCAQRYEQTFLTASKIIIDLSRDLYKDNPELKSNYKGKKFIEKINWKDVDLEDDKFIMTLFPVSALPSTPAGKLQFVQELIQSGFIDQDMGISLLDFPDVDSYMNLRNAAMDDIKMILEQMLNDGIYESPDPRLNLQLAFQMTQSTYLRSKVNKAPEERLELLQQYMDEIETILNPPQAAPPPMPMAVPEEPPVSDLLPPIINQ